MIAGHLVQRPGGHRWTPEGFHGRCRGLVGGLQALGEGVALGGEPVWRDGVEPVQRLLHCCVHHEAFIHSSVSRQVGGIFHKPSNVQPPLRVEMDDVTAGRRSHRLVWVRYRYPPCVQRTGRTAQRRLAMVGRSRISRRDQA